MTPTPGLRVKLVERKNHPATVTKVEVRNRRQVAWVKPDDRKGVVHCSFPICLELFDKKCRVAS